MDQAPVFTFQLFQPQFCNYPPKLSILSSAYNKLQMKGDGRKSKSRRKSYQKNIITKGLWSSLEDRLLVQLVKQYGDSKWSRVAEKLPGRIAKQCRDRWQNHLRPDLTKGAWSEEEDKLLIAIHREVGNKWSEIAKRLPGRSENTIKNHWNATKRRQLSPKQRDKTKHHSLLLEYIRSISSCSSQDHINTKQTPDILNESTATSQARPTATFQKSFTKQTTDILKESTATLQTRPTATLQTRPTANFQKSFSSDVAATYSPFVEGYGLGGMFGYIPGGSVVNESWFEFDQGPSHLTSQLEFDFQKERDFLEMLYQ